MKQKLCVTVLVILATIMSALIVSHGAEKAASTSRSGNEKAAAAEDGTAKGEARSAEATASAAKAGQETTRPGEAPSRSRECLKIGVVSVRKIFQDCKRNAKYRQEFAAEGDKMEAELEKLSKEIDLDKAGLKTLKPGSPDYSNLIKELFEKRGQLQAKQEYFKQLMDMRQQTVLEQLFKDIVQATAQVAKEKSFDLVLEKSEPEQPGDIGTQKVLYSAGCEDITDAVMAKVDANSP